MIYQNLHDDYRLHPLFGKAKNGDVEAQFELARQFEKNSKAALTRFERELDESRAISLLNESAEGGHAQAQFELGKKMIYGEGIKRDVKSGMKLLENSFNSGFAYAGLYIAMLYDPIEYKRLVTGSSLKAIKWYKMTVRKAIETNAYSVEYLATKAVESKKTFLNGVLMGACYGAVTLLIAVSILWN